MQEENAGGGGRLDSSGVEVTRYRICSWGDPDWICPPRSLCKQAQSPISVIEKIIQKSRYNRHRGNSTSARRAPFKRFFQRLLTRAAAIRSAGWFTKQRRGRSLGDL
jgi:hypothetical protein